MILILLRCCCCVGYNSMMCISSMKRMLRWGAHLVHLGDSFGVVCMMMEKGVLPKIFANDDDACYCSTCMVWVFRSCQCCQMMVCFHVLFVAAFDQYLR